MKNTALLILIQGILSLLCGILSSQMSFIGRMSIQLMYRDYLIFKSWWKTALVCFLIQLLIIFLLAVLKAYAGLRTVRILAFVLLLTGLIGACLTYLDFTTTSHRFMRTKFHIAGYLFWFSWCINGIYFMVSRKKKAPLETLSETVTLEKEEQHTT